MNLNIQNFNIAVVTDLNDVLCDQIFLQKKILLTVHLIDMLSFLYLSITLLVNIWSVLIENVFRLQLRSLQKQISSCSLETYFRRRKPKLSNIDDKAVWIG